MSGGGGGQSRIYVGNLPTDYGESDIKGIFAKYGEVVTVDLKDKKGPPHFAFVEFADERDAEDAVRSRDGYRTSGHTLHVEFTRGSGPRGVALAGRGPGVTRRGGISGAPAFRGIGYRVYVSGLPPSGSWQDVKDHMRQAGDVCSADVDRSRDGTGWCEFVRQSDAKYAAKKLDDTKFRSHKGETSYVRVFMDEADARADGGGASARPPSKSRSRSRSPRTRRPSRDSPTYSPLRRSSSSRSRSRSSRSRSRSASSSRSSSGGRRRRRHHNSQHGSHKNSKSTTTSSSRRRGHRSRKRSSRRSRS